MKWVEEFEGGGEVEREVISRARRRKERIWAKFVMHEKVRGDHSWRDE